MNFFQRQAEAHQRSGYLVAMFMLCVFAVAGLSALVLDFGYNVYMGSSAISRDDTNQNQTQKLQFDKPIRYLDENIIYPLVGVAAIIVFAAWMKQLELGGGGSGVASVLGARPISSSTTDPDERKLLNIVEEMSIASTIPAPQVFVMDNERGINACAAGTDTTDVAIVVTRGAIELLNRDELQAVIGHEYSHIFNGDMSLNMQLTCMAFGVMCVYSIGRFVMESTWRVGSYSDRDDAKGQMVVVFVGFALVILGSLGAFFGALLQSALSCQRELLADASSAQYTRNPLALASALKKVAACEDGGIIRHAGSSQFSHFFFADAVRFLGLATHPPILERIKALDPSFNGKIEYDKLAWPPPKQITEQPVVSTNMAPNRSIIAGGGALNAVFGGAGLAGPTGLGRVSAGSGGPDIMNTGSTVPHPAPAGMSGLQVTTGGIDDGLPMVLRAAARDLTGASAVVFAMLLSSDNDTRSKQLVLLTGKANQFVYNEMRRLLPLVDALPADEKLPLACLAVPTLRQLSMPQFTQFKSVMNELIGADQKIDLFEFMLQKMVQRYLDGYFGSTKERKLITMISQLSVPCETILSAVAYIGTEDLESEAALHSALTSLGLRSPTVIDKHFSLAKLEAAFTLLNDGDFDLRSAVVKAATQIVLHDGKVTLEEKQLLIALADALEAKIPPEVFSAMPRAASASAKGAVV